MAALLTIEVFEIVVHEAHEPSAIAHLLDPHPLPREHLAEVHLHSVVTDAATAVGVAVQSWDGRSLRLWVTFDFRYERL